MSLLDLSKLFKKHITTTKKLLYRGFDNLIKKDDSKTLEGNAHYVTVMRVQGFGFTACTAKLWGAIRHPEISFLVLIQMYRSMYIVTLEILHKLLFFGLYYLVCGYGCLLVNILHQYL